MNPKSRYSAKWAALPVAFLLILMSPLLSCAQQSAPAGLGRGVNFGNILEAPYEGAWGLVLTEELFQAVADLGFEHIRLPVSWTYHTQQTAPYVIDEAMLDRVEWAIQQALSRNLKIIVNVHHYDEIHANPSDELPRFLAMWQQIAARYKDYGDSVLFEVLNEPHGVYNEQPALWNDHLAQALTVIRSTQNPTRKVLVGPVNWNSIDALDDLEIPNDPNLIATVHNYEPFNFTHQGAPWLDPIPPVGVRWHPRTRAPTSDWQNWSWDTQIEETWDGVEIKYDRDYASFSLHANKPLKDVTHLVFVAQGAVDLDVWVLDDQYQGNAVRVTTQAGEKSYTIPRNQFGDINNVTNIWFQKTDATNATEWTNVRTHLRLQDGSKHWVVNTNRVNLQQMMTTATRWANAKNVPMYLGEFGTHDEAIQGDRVRWTKILRQESEALKIDWGYWSIGGSMGFYNQNNGNLNMGLVNALLPN